MSSSGGKMFPNGFGADPCYSHDCPYCDQRLEVGEYCQYCFDRCKYCAGVGSLFYKHVTCDACGGTGLRQKCKQGASNMNTKEAITLIQLSTGATIVSARYLVNNGNAPLRDYHFKNVVGVALSAGDIIVVQTKDQLSLVTVQNPDVLPTELDIPMEQLKHVVCKVDTSLLDAVQTSERRAVHELSMSEVNSKLDAFRQNMGNDRYGKVQNLLTVCKPVAPAATCDGKVGGEDEVIDYGNVPKQQR